MLPSINCAMIASNCSITNIRSCYGGSRAKIRVEPTRDAPRRHGRDARKSATRPIPWSLRGWRRTRLVRTAPWFWKFRAPQIPERDLGRDVGADLTKAKVRYLVRRECAVSAADILWRRTKVGLRLSQAAIASVDEYLKQIVRRVATGRVKRGGKQGCRSFSIALGYRSAMTS